VRQIGEAAVEFNEVYLPDLQKRIAERRLQEEQRQSHDLAALQKDMHSGEGQRQPTRAATEQREEEEEDEEEEEEEG
jgi:hypothetical protein